MSATIVPTAEEGGGKKGVTYLLPPEKMGDDAAGAAPEPSTTPLRGIQRNASARWYEEEVERSVEEDLAMIENMLRTPPEQKYVLMPLSPRMQQWDKLMVALLIFTALMTPFEVAFLETKIGVLFVVNRLVDLGFVIDIFVNFNLAYKDEENPIWVFKKNLIAKRYLKSWFAIDFVSILPFDSLGLIMNSSKISDLKVFRIIRLLRLLKLMRVLKSMRIISRLQATLGISFATFALIQLLLSVIICMHWVACIWMLAGQVDDTGKSTLTDYDSTWVIEGGLACPLDPNECLVDSAGAYDEVDNCTAEYNPGEDFDDCEFGGERLETVLTEYLGAMEFSMMIMVMGYGAFEPANPVERGVSIFAMVIAGCTYAYAIGDICGVVSMRNPAQAEYQQTMDTLNAFMAEIKLPQPKRVELREFFMACKDMFEMRYYTGVLNDMSPKMRGQVAEFTHGEWIRKIPFFTCTNKDEAYRFLSSIAVHLTPYAYAPMEEVYRSGDISDQMYIIHKGVCAGNGRVLGREKFFGEDMILKNNRRQWAMRALTFLFTYTLTHEMLMEILEQGDYPRTAKLVRKASIKMALQNKFLEIRRLYRSNNALNKKVGAKDVKAWKRKMYNQQLVREASQRADGLDVMSDEEKREMRRVEWEKKLKEKEEEETKKKLAFYLGEEDDDAAEGKEAPTIESLAASMRAMSKMVEQLVIMVGTQQQKVGEAK